ncbi:MAG: hypothetical protein DSM107014_02720 [Gomphosphaeria aponina SAG 52.96 = DSM 107014]|uniref:Uncharacterized protein n=1 Tax=Gomphosphaeria aponina SAG 52.96 = DSM 107014 TaxID=1521640 RepID=A0A941GMF1_9CHRO|nr:hypothetical protein [Gomphosphaeria aponina SAG 52.96 = DSM 107014]
MAIIALKAWYLEQYEPIKEVIKRPHDLRLSRNSMLKSGLRADFLDDTEEVEKSVWFEHYLQGETVEFYIEGSGGYVLSNIDLISHEMYLTKQEITSVLEPVIFFSSQTEYGAASGALREVLSTAIANFKGRSRLSLTLEEAPRPTAAPLRLSSSQLRKIRKSLLFVADGTAVGRVVQENVTKIIPNANVCVEIGYALANKRSGQILLAYMERSDYSGQFPFDLPGHQQLGFKNTSELAQTLPLVLENMLQKFNLLPSR